MSSSNSGDNLITPARFVKTTDNYSEKRATNARSNKWKQISTETMILGALRDQNLSPLQIANLLRLDLSDTQKVIGDLLQRNLVEKTSDGFSGLLHITREGRARLDRAGNPTPTSSN